MKFSNFNHMIIISKNKDSFYTFSSIYFINFYYIQILL